MPQLKAMVFEPAFGGGQMILIECHGFLPRLWRWSNFLIECHVFLNPSLAVVKSNFI